MTAEKKISGVKLHIGVDILGLPNGIHVTKANVGDREGALEMLELYAPKLTNILKVLVDGGYTGEAFANSVMTIIINPLEISCTII